MPNRLAASASPYLLAHAHNPVDWFPWADEALTLARTADRPILLSIGYSACHWCHVMERESFEDAAVAELMNAAFVNIKVDREERPDLDAIYMSAVQAFTGGHGGWPMTVFLLPDGRPYFGGTYFPPSPSRGMPSFRQVLAHARRLFGEQRREAEAVGAQVLERLRVWERLPAAADDIALPWLEAVIEAATQDEDRAHGGFGGAPKFPPHATISVLLAAHARDGDPRVGPILRRVLDGMARGGMNDLLAGGFARYSVDARWEIPHFEKMLYDNALLAPLYAEAAVLFDRPAWGRVARETLAFLEHALSDPRGGFFASMDADSEGEEGRYFVWTPTQLAQRLGPHDGARAAILLGVTRDGTFEHGASVLRTERLLLDLTPVDRAFLDDVVFPALRAARGERVPPATDTKIVASWNALAISAFARVAAALGDGALLARAERAARFLLGPMTVEGRLLRTERDGVLGPPAFSEDYAFLLAALLDLGEASGDPRWNEAALALADQTLALFWDEEDGGLFLVGRDAEALVATTKSPIGGALPSANGVAALAFLRLRALTGRADLEEKAERIVRSYAPLLGQAARALGPEALAGQWLVDGPVELGIRGAPDDPRTLALLAAARRHPSPLSARVWGESADAAAFMADRPAADAPTAWVCRDRACHPPVGSGDQLAALLRPPPRSDRPGRVRAPPLPTDAAAFVGGPPFALAQLAGRVVVLDFFAPCCVNCRHGLAELHRALESLGDAAVTVISVLTPKFDYEATVEGAQSAAAAHGRGGPHHRVLRDVDRGLWEAYAIRAWPTLVVLDPQGREAFRRSGEVPAEDLIRVISGLLTGGDPARASTVESDRATDAPARAWDSARLRFPEKLHVWPAAEAQAEGADPLDGAGVLYVADTGRHRVLACSLRRDADGWPRARWQATFGVADAPGRQDGPLPRFQRPRGLVRDGDRLLVADSGNHQVRAIDLRSGAATTLLGSGQLGRNLSPGDPRRPLEMDLRSPDDVALSDGAVLVAMAGSHQIWVLLTDRSHAGPLIGSGAEGHVDGPVAEAALAQPSGLAVYGRFLAWVDAETSSVRLVDLQGGEVSTLVGRGLFEFGDVDGHGGEVRFQHPCDLAITEGAIFVADTYNGKIKQIDPATGETRTLAAGLCEPTGVEVVGEFLIVADTGNHRLVAVRRRDGAQRELVIEEAAG